MSNHHHTSDRETRDRGSDSADKSPLGGLRRLWLPLVCLVLCIIFVNLGVWQLKRLEWKNGLIERIQRNTVMDAFLLQQASELSSLQTDADEYRRVRLSGSPDCTRAIPVWAATQLGSGYWWMVPVTLQDNSVVWVNRGFVTMEAIAAWRNGHQLSCSPIQLEGLLRRSQSGGGFLRPNDPGAGRWYSRDLVQMSESVALHVASVAWFVDEWPALSGTDALSRGESVDQPVQGLTPLTFPNKHLGYALTWFSLSLACVAAGVLALRSKV